MSIAVYRERLADLEDWQRDGFAGADTQLSGGRINGAVKSAADRAEARSRGATP
jgi:hypothetical protein